MEIQQFLKEICLPEEGRDSISEFKLQEESYQKFFQLFDENEERFFQTVNKQPDKERWYLYLYVRFAVDLYSQYTEEGIPDKIYYDTFSDFTIWFQRCMREKHILGLMEENWLKLHLKMKLFRLGRLQFEKDERTKRIHIHIPEGQPLSPEACDLSMLQAEKFFDRSYTLFDCKSWLLAPALSELLEKENRIIQFQKRFHIEHIDMESRQAEERVFGKIQDDKNVYPENTSLQRALKKYVLAGNNPGVGFGIIPRKLK